MDQQPTVPAPNTPQEPTIPPAPQPTPQPMPQPMPQPTPQPDQPMQPTQPQQPPIGEVPAGNMPSGVPSSPKSNKKLIIIIICAVLALIGIGVGVYFLTKKPADDKSSSKSTSKDQKGSDKSALDEFMEDVKRIEKEAEDSGDPDKYYQDQKDAALGEIDTMMARSRFSLAQSTISDAISKVKRGESGGSIKKSDLEDIKKFVLLKDNKNKWFSTYGSTIQGRWKSGATATYPDVLILSTDKQCAIKESLLDTEEWAQI